MDTDAGIESTEFSDYVMDRMRQLEVKNDLLKQQYHKVETEKQDAEDQRLKYEREIRKLQSELNTLKATPQLIGTLVKVLEGGKSIVRSSTGPEFIVGTSQFMKDGDLVPGVQVALNKENLSIISIVPEASDPMVQAMEVIESPDVSYDRIGGLDKQIEALKGAAEFPLTKPEVFERIGVDPPRGVLLYGPPGTGKTLLAKAVAARTDATFIRVVGSEFAQKYVGEGARLVREVFKMARKKAPSILFIDEIDSIGAMRLDDASSGGREVQRTLTQLLTEMDGFDRRGEVCIIAATNRPDILDPALIRPGRFDRLIEIPMPNNEARVEILHIHTGGMRLADDVDLAHLAKLATDNANGAALRAIAMEAGMCAVREEQDAVYHKDFEDAIEHIMDPGGARNRRTESMFA